MLVWVACVLLADFHFMTLYYIRYSIIFSVTFILNEQVYSEFRFVWMGCIDSIIDVYI